MLRLLQLLLRWELLLRWLLQALRGWLQLLLRRILLLLLLLRLLLRVCLRSMISKIAAAVTMLSRVSCVSVSSTLRQQGLPLVPLIIAACWAVMGHSWTMLPFMRFYTSPTTNVGTW